MLGAGAGITATTGEGLGLGVAGAFTGVSLLGAGVLCLRLAECAGVGLGDGLPAAIGGVPACVGVLLVPLNSSNATATITPRTPAPTPTVLAALECAL